MTNDIRQELLHQFKKGVFNQSAGKSNEALRILLMYLMFNDCEQLLQTIIDKISSKIDLNQIIYDSIKEELSI